MDWFSWLTKTGLEPSLVYEYGLAFSHNELEEDDIAYFNHEFLQSMGISIAKHRLEILKLARKEKGVIGSPHPMSRLVLAIRRTKRCLAKYVTGWGRCDDPTLAIAPSRSYSSRWKAAMLKRNKRLLMARQERLLLTNGASPMAISGPLVYSFSSPMVLHLPGDEKTKADDNEYWSTGVEETRWDTMFQDLKPT